MAGLSPEFPLPIVVMLHLPPAAAVEGVLANLPLRVERLQGGQQLTAGTVWMCPPRAFVELLPDGRCVVSDNPGGAMDRPIDRLLTSAARSFGPRAIGVILTGMGTDGAAGARDLRGAGGRVLVQTPAGAETPDMPKAAIAAGAADLVVPLDALGEVISEFAQGAPRSRARSELRAIRAAFGDRGAVAAAALELDWEATLLGAVLAWPDMLRLRVRETLDAANASAVWWDSQQVEIYNDAWGAFLGDEHPVALGRPAVQNWSRSHVDWGRMGVIAAQVMGTGQPVASAPLAFLVSRSGAVEEVFASFSCAPLRDVHGQVLGLRCNLWDTTRDIVAQRRMQLLHSMVTRMSHAANQHDACAFAAEALNDAPADIAFALVYLVDLSRRQATLACAAGLTAGSSAAPRLVHVAGGARNWPLERVLPESAQAVSSARPTAVVDDLLERFPELQAALAPGRQAGPGAVLLPLHATPESGPLGVAIIGLPPHRPYDELHAAFVELLGRQMAAGLGEARARELERDRLERLAALDRAKTDFFSNVSHEFRTPLTLLLAPLEDLARERETLPRRVASELDAALRNARRLLRLVNNLLDFSQIEVRGRKALVTPTDLGELTEDITSAFRSAVEAAGLRLHLEIAPGLPPVPVNGPMWEQIVSNLLSNALKFTFEGAITVRLKALRLHAELEVTDTGIGIDAEELPNIFKRFHRVRGARARTSEGSGIGLAVVHDLVRRMGGQLTVRSIAGRGSTFTIWLPLQPLTARTELGEEPAKDAAQRQVAADLATEASRWSDRGAPDGVIDDVLDPPPAEAGGMRTSRGRLLIADDNADLRAYLRRLLGAQWDVQLAADGEQALASAREQAPDVVLADVMMPGLDGFQLLQHLREEPGLAQVPIVLLTARASEEAAIEGLLAGADDYIAKPFSPRELVARVRAVVDRSRADAALRASESKYRTLFESIDEGFCVVDVIEDEGGKAVDVAFVEVNPAYRRQTGIGDVVGKRALEIAPDMEQHWLDLYGSVAQTGRAVRTVDFNSDTGRWFDMYVSRVGGADSRRIAIVFGDITERQRAELRQAFLLRLSDALRPLSDPVAIQQTAMRVLGEHLRVNRAFYADGQGDDSVILRPGYVDGVFPLEGIIRFAEFDKTMADVYRAGETFVIRDTHADPRFDAQQRANFDTLGMRAGVGVPLLKEGRMRAILSVHQTAPRNWTDDEIALLHETAERTWDAAERVRAEAASRESEARLSFLMRLGDALRTLGDEGAIEQTATRMLTEHLDVRQAHFAHYVGDHAEVRHEFRRSGRSFVGRYRMQDWPDTVRRCERGEAVLVQSLMQASEHDREGWAALGMVSLAIVPVLREGRLITTLSICDDVQHAWTPRDVEFMTETAERTWLAIERLRVEAALRGGGA